MKWYVRNLTASLASLFRFDFLSDKADQNPVPFNDPIYERDLVRILDAIAGQKAAGFDFTGKTIIELTGGLPPLFSLAAALLKPKAIHLIDPCRRLTDEAVRKAARILRAKAALVAEKLGVHPRSVALSLAQTDFMPASEIERLFLVNYHRPGPDGAFYLPSGFADLAVSFDVLEHLPPASLTSIHDELKRVLKPRGALLHDIDTADHWSYYDKSISAANFLKFGERAWKFLSAAGCFYQNRLRESDYETLFKTTGFAIRGLIITINTAAVTALGHLRVSQQFMTGEKKLLATGRVQFTLMKKPEEEKAHAAEAGGRRGGKRNGRVVPGNTRILRVGEIQKELVKR
jgi:hypothetical protein